MTEEREKEEWELLNHGFTAEDFDDEYWYEDEAWYEDQAYFDELRETQDQERKDKLEDARHRSAKRRRR